MIRLILRDNNIPGKPRFKVRLFNAGSAKGSTDLIQLPSGYPLLTILKTGDIVDPLAMIHHELGHTRFYRKHQAGKLVSIQDEREAVIQMENPVRMYNKNEPRYAYYNGDGSHPFTINIITGETKAGIWAFDKTDPRKMILAK